MFSHIKTSKENKEVVTQLTNKLNLGAENVIARIGLALSLAQEQKLDLKDLKDSGGKEYSKSVLLGDNFDIYIGMICNHHNIKKIDKDLSKYIKLHLDNGLYLIDKHIKNQLNFDSFGFLSSLINSNLAL
jgi:DNA sulfur modification protein DndE